MSDHRGKYLIPRRSETRGLVGIGFLAVALIAGGGTQSYDFGRLSDITHTTQLEAIQSTSTLPALTPIAAIQAQPIVTPVGPVFEGLATHYGVQYNGSRMGCVGEPYSSDDETIIAVGPAHEGEWPCGTQLRVCGAAGCIVGYRQDSCPGCGSYHIDLSEVGITTACGDQAHICRVGIEEVLVELPEQEAPPAFEAMLPAITPVSSPILYLNLEALAVPSPLFNTGLEPVP